MTGSGLQYRNTAALELMDDPGCDLDKLERTYAQFTLVNRVVSGWHRIYRRRIRPVLCHRTRNPDRPIRVLDIGFGGGDIPLALARWAQRDGLPLHVTAIDPDERALAYVRRRPNRGVHFEQASSRQVVERGDRFDVVISNHVLHHLDPPALAELLEDSTVLTDGPVIHSDLRRGRLGYAAFAAATLPLRRRSFLHQDGLLSIRRSYRAAELRAAVPTAWTVETVFPQRLLLLHAGSSG